MNKSEEICRLLGIHWHEWEKKRGSFKSIYGDTRQNKNQHFYCKVCGKMKRKGKNENPDFTTKSGRVELIEITEKHPQGNLFFANLMYGSNNIEAIDDDGNIDRRYITEPDLLIDAVIQFLTARKG